LSTGPIIASGRFIMMWESDGIHRVVSNTAKASFRPDAASDIFGR
jgi:hypothetical protein